MYWGQIAIAAVSAIGAIWFTVQNEQSIGTGFAIGVVVYICVRWVIAWVYRIRYWLNRGTQGIYYERCPNCDAQRYRKQGKWILKCHTCGWKPGWPGFRWITRSVPSIQFRRTVIGPKLLVVVVAAVLVVSGLTAGVTIGSFDSVADGSALAGESPSKAGNDNTPTPQTDSSRPTTTDTDDKGLNNTRIGRWIWIYTNIERSQHGLSNVSYAPRIASAAREHSENMAKHDYIGHTEPNGETGEERYQDVCDYTGSGYSFGENAASAYYEESFTAWGTNETVYLTTEKELAKYLVNGWMRSDGHRANILNEEWTELGVGIAVSGNKVYASQTFC
ncbi:CAP domain-containing protein [Halorhabdus sp. CUG00001]|uniref:CAP domain-containing protein n=1 Tax=Halorhabdus sp. CUG00001 TaxID=2600297 RepID=UPI001E618008|nr:CAP domain-containing protein [Halorhabdus sp. CUG00001]